MMMVIDNDDGDNDGDDDVKWPKLNSLSNHT